MKHSLHSRQTLFLATVLKILNDETKSDTLRLFILNGILKLMVIYKFSNYEA